MVGKLRKVGELATVLVFAVAFAYCSGFILEAYVSPLAPLLSGKSIFGVTLDGVTWVIVSIPVSIFLAVVHWLIPPNEPAPPRVVSNHIY